MSERAEGLIRFVDSERREWHPRLTGRAVLDFETRTGIGVVESIFSIFFGKDGDEMERDGHLPASEVITGILAGDPKAYNQPDYIQSALRVGRTVFGKLSNLYFLLYVSCRDTFGKVQDPATKAEITFEMFAQAIGPEKQIEAIGAVFALVETSFPSKAEMEELFGELMKEESESPPATSPAEPEESSSSSPPGQE